ncbi:MULTISPECIES: Zn-dependent hydrolase [Gammaproteobacteria]|uniref:Zn-dependent hydrolase n=1 Tax=Gammaproteobacteria TaxID=1236 RepID=UPI000DD0DD56|nr:MULTISPECIES: Zn-dependent hydrolase [Gammaproteobacteria]RTE86759.1 Zn-dependent hydrolase [Aliidiomarina sp. B3213]TCZ90687.1 Zn-dependent hydrolase [Lysobacter sp. N42]
MPNINLPRLKESLMELSRIGFNPDDKGIYRSGFTDADMEARRWLIDLAKNDGFSADMDGAGNVWLGYDTGKHEEDSAVVMGSHLDSVPAGGMFDGSLGVMAGLEVMRTVRDHELNLQHPLKVLGTAEEEGRFGGMFGVQAITGDLTPEWILSAHDADGVYLADEMKKQGLDPMGALDAAWQKDQMKAYLELHIEQGPVLDLEKIPLGVVEGISGVFKWIVKLKGKADHAGTAPMHMRSDAFMGLADFAHEIQRIIDEWGTDMSRITVGKVDLKPGYPHTVPGEVIFTIVGRDMSEDVMKALSEACERTLRAISRRHRLHFEYDEVSWLGPNYCAPSMIDLMEIKAKERGWEYKVMPSGAGHDVQFFTHITESGLIFIPSVGGVSHAPDEWSHWHHIEMGTNLLLDCAIERAST